MNIRQIYERERLKPRPQTPAEAWIDTVAKATCKSSATVRSWLYQGTRPDALTAKLLAQLFNTTPEELFGEDAK